MKRFLIVMMLPAMAAANTNVCSLQERSVTRTDVVIQERTAVEKVVIPQPRNRRKCTVNFQVRANNQWHAAHGEHVWPGDQPENEACAIAAARAESDVKFRVGRGYHTTERVLVCNDDGQQQPLTNSLQVGRVGKINQFRPHPKYTESFYYNGTQCRWFVDPEFNGQTVKTAQGIICELKDSNWVVVEKF